MKLFNLFKNLFTTKHEVKPVKPGDISVVITEKDRTEAKEYANWHDCLIATALKNAGYKQVRVGMSTAVVDGSVYFFDKEYDVAETCAKMFAPRVHYGRKVVGMQVVLRKSY